MPIFIWFVRLEIHLQENNILLFWKERGTEDNIHYWNGNMQNKLLPFSLSRISQVSKKINRACVVDTEARVFIRPFPDRN